MSNVSETYVNIPRATSSHMRWTYDNLVDLSNIINFNHPNLKHYHMRNRSVGSVQALIVELALQDDDFRLKLEKYFIKDSRWYYVERDSMYRLHK